MSQHEKGLLILILFLLITIFWGAFLGSRVLEVTLLVALFSALKSSWWGLVGFWLFGGIGFYYELTTIDRNLGIIETEAGGKNNDPLAFRTAIIVGICWVILALLLTAPPYLLGNKDIVLNMCYYLMIIGTIFLFLFAWMFVGAVIARIRRRGWG